MSAETRLAAEKLQAGYHHSPLLYEIALQVHSGEILTLIGQNGTGKSTLLKTLCGQLAPLCGAVLLSGKELQEYSGTERARRLSVLLTERLKTEMMTCLEVIETGRYPYTGSFGILSQRDHDAVNRAVELVQIEELAERDFSEISDGQRQLVLLARAICQEPQVMLLDEPTSYLDISHKIRFLEILRKLAREQRMAVILSMHELELAARVADKVICLKGEGIFRFGAPQEIFQPEVICEAFDLDPALYEKYGGGKGC